MELPLDYCQGDGKWIKEQLGKVAYSLRNRVLLRYAEVYREVYAKTPISYQKEGEARREANTRLREFVERHGVLDRVSKPPLSD